MGKHREIMEWIEERWAIMGKHMVYTCDRCHEESKQRRAQVSLPTGKNGTNQMWDLCKVCFDEHTKLTVEQTGQLRAFVAGVELPPEANVNPPSPFNQSAYAGSY